MDKFQPENNQQMPADPQLVTVHIDGEPVQLPKGDNLLEAILSKKYNLPYFCWHPSMGSIGACRQCALTLYADQEQQRGKTIMACMTPVTEGMYLGLNEQHAAEFREQIISAMMTNHPHDCPVCGEGGACHLQDMTVMTGHSHRQYQGQKRTFTNQYLGPLVNHEMNRCITCYRCERFYKDYAGGKDFAAYGSKNQVYFGRQQDGVLESEFAGNLVEVCPTGVFTDKPFAAHYTRKWDLQSSPSICHGCSVGCNISVGERYSAVRRVINRYHDDINGYFICDKGRFGFAHVNSENRLTKISGLSLSTPFAPHDFSIAMAKFKSKSNLGVGSTRASLETNGALKQLVGSENFCSGLSSHQQDCLRICQSLMVAGRQVNIKEIEASDCIIILDEDLTQTSARVALAVRQATRNAAFERAEQMGIPRWQDDAVRTAAQELKSDLYLLQSKSSKLDDVATYCSPLSAGKILSVAEAILTFIDDIDAEPEPVRAGADEPLSDLISAMQKSLKKAKNPLIIGGCSHWHLPLLQTIESIAEKAPEHWQFAVLPDSVNSLGLMSLLDENSLSIEQLQAKSLADTTLIVAENSLPGLTTTQKRHLAQQSQTLIVIDHYEHLLSELADIVLPSTPFTESDGVVVNYTGLAQPFYAAKPQVQPLHMAWQWCRLLAEVIANGKLHDCLSLAQLRTFLHQQEVSFPDMGAMMAEHLLFKSARQSMRYSGRTAMIANQTVHEPKNPVDTNSPYSFSMEGPGKSRIDGQALARPFSWAPGWNSNQSVSKYQVKVAGPMLNRAKGMFLTNHDGNLNKRDNHTKPATDPFSVSINGLQVRKLEHLFSNDEFSDAIAEFRLMAPKPCLLINAGDADKIAESNCSHVQVEFADESAMTLQLITCQDVARGMAFLHHPRANKESLLAQIVAINVATEGEVAVHQQALKDDLQFILNQKNRNLARLQKQDQMIPIQFVGEGSR